MKKTFTALSIISAVLALASSCKNDKHDNPAPSYTVPTTYNFTNANFADATTRLGMVTEMSTYMKNATNGNAFEAQPLKNMFANVNAPFTGAAASYNTSGLQIKDQCAARLQADVPNFIDILVASSKTGKTAAKGQAGIGASAANAASKYALDARGINYAQMFNKSIMGGLITYQIVNAMTTAVSPSLDNNTVVAGKGTAAEHNWDMAFGYWGVPIDFPTNKTGAKLWGSYSTQVDSGFHANKILMDAFLKGRAAISNKDNKTRDEQATIILQTMEKLTGAAALQEVKEAKESLNDPILLNSRLSECYGFVNSLKYNPKRVITDAQIDALLALFPSSFYDLTLDKLNAIRDAVAKQYGFEAVKDIL